MRVRRPLLLALATTLVLVGCTGGSQVADFGPGQPTEETADLPGVAGVDLADVPEPDEVPPVDAALAQADWPQTAAWIRRENAEGRAVVVNFFASWCEPCKRELPMLIAAAAAEPEITFLGITYQDQRAASEEMIEEYGVDYPTFDGGAGDAAYEVGALGMPTTVAFDTDGILVARVIGEVNATSLEQMLDEVR